MKQVVTLCAVSLLALVSPSLGRQCVCSTSVPDDRLNVRRCAGTTCQIIGTIGTAECLDYRDTQIGNWIAVWWPEPREEGWVHANFASGPQTCGGPGTGLCCGTVCTNNSNNHIRGCDPMGCGHYGASRGTRSHSGSDVLCSAGDDILAPFPGRMVRRARPYGNGSCCDDGFVFAGTGAWEGYELKAFYNRPDERWGQEYEEGEVIASHIGLHCGCYSSSMTDHLHFEFSKDGRVIDPSSFLHCH